MNEENSGKEKGLEALSGLLINPMPWKRSILFIVLIGIAIDFIGWLGVFRITYEGVYLPFFGIFALSVPALFAAVLSPVMFRMNGKRLDPDWSAFLSFAGVVICLIFTYIPAVFLFSDIHIFFAISLAFVFSVRILAMMILADNRFPAAAGPALSQSLFATLTGSIYLADEFFVLAILLQLFFGVGMYLFVWMIDAPLKKTFGFSGLGFANAFMAHISEGSLALDQIYRVLGEEVFVPEVSLFFRREGKDDAIFTVPNLHPGPLGDTGGSNLPKLLHDRLGEDTFVPHGCATHDFNPVSSTEVEKVTKAINSTRDSLLFGNTAGRSVVSSYGMVNVTAQPFGDSALLICTRSPEITDDVDFSVGLAIMEGGKRSFKHIALVDAHNCMEEIAKAVLPASKKSVEYIRACEGAIDGISDSGEYEFEVGAARVEVPFSRKQGFGDLGIQALAVIVDGQTSLYLLIDGNNMKAGVREEIIDHIKSTCPVDVCEVMTTDTHVVNTISGKNPVGMAVPFDEFRSYVDDAVKGALDDLSPAKVAGSTAWCDGVEVFGSQKVSQLAGAVSSMVGIMVPAAIIVIALAFISTMLIYYLIMN